MVTWACPQQSLWTGCKESTRGWKKMTVIFSATKAAGGVGIFECTSFLCSLQEGEYWAWAECCIHPPSVMSLTRRLLLRRCNSKSFRWRFWRWGALCVFLELFSWSCEDNPPKRNYKKNMYLLNGNEIIKIFRDINKPWRSRKPEAHFIEYFWI